jgi:hypothetical protein
MPNFEVFKKRMTPLVKQPYVTLQRRGTMSFNKAAYQALGSPEAVELLYDKSEGIMGLRPVSATEQHAYPLRASNNETTYMLSATAFTKYYEIKTDVSRRFAARMEDGILCIDLDGPALEVTGNRSAVR